MSCLASANRTRPYACNFWIDWSLFISQRQFLLCCTAAPINIVIRPKIWPFQIYRFSALVHPVTGVQVRMKQFSSLCSIMPRAGIFKIPLPHCRMRRSMPADKCEPHCVIKNPFESVIPTRLEKKPGPGGGTFPPASLPRRAACRGMLIVSHDPTRSPSHTVTVTIMPRRPDLRGRRRRSVTSEIVPYGASDAVGADGHRDESD